MGDFAPGVYVEACPRLERVGRGLFEGEEAVLHVMGLLAGVPWASRLLARRGATRWWPGGRPVVDRAEGALVPKPR